MRRELKLQPKHWISLSLATTNETLQEQGETVETVETVARSEPNPTEPKSRFLVNTLQFQIPQDKLKELFNF